MRGHFPLLVRSVAFFASPFDLALIPTYSLPLYAKFLDKVGNSSRRSSYSRCVATYYRLHSAIFVSCFFSFLSFFSPSSLFLLSFSFLFLFRSIRPTPYTMLLLWLHQALPTSLTWILLTAGLCVSCPLVIQGIYNLYFHPLRNTPGPNLGALTDFYAFYWNWIRGGGYS